MRLCFTIVALFVMSMLSRVPSDAAAPSPAPDAWPQLLHTAAHTSLSHQPALNSTTAAKLGINWMSAMRAADLGSPVSAYNAALGIPIAYVGDERGDLIAYNEVNGTTVWSTSLGFNDLIRSTPMVAPDGTVWAGTGLNPTIYKLDGATGQVICKIPVMLRIDASIAFGTPPGGVPTVYASTIDGNNIINGQLLAIQESNCKQEWAFTGWRNPSGAWDTPALGVDAKGRGLVFAGSSSPDEEMYAVDALTGKLTWYRSAYIEGDYDIGAAPTVSPPGVNGFADGVL
jgi:outer membrane protein assembly factor BamB